MAKHLLLVDYENVPRIDLTVVDDSYRAVVFVGAGQNPPKSATRSKTAHRFKRVEFQKIAGSGKNALDFHIAFQLGRTFETAKDTICIVVSRDKRFDPLLLHLNSNGLQCRRVDGFAELAIVCDRCKGTSTIEHNGGRWCSICGTFARPPDPLLEPSHRVGYRDPSRVSHEDFRRNQVCGWCHQVTDVGDGVYDDGEWMCGGCIAGFTDEPFAGDEV